MEEYFTGNSSFEIFDIMSWPAERKRLYSGDFKSAGEFFTQDLTQETFISLTASISGPGWDIPEIEYILFKISM